MRACSVEALGDRIDWLAVWLSAAHAQLGRRPESELVGTQPLSVSGVRANTGLTGVARIDWMQIGKPSLTWFDLHTRRGDLL